MASFDRPRGTRDFDPDETARRRALQARLRDVFDRYGYEEVQTPTFEHLELFTEKSGEEIVQQLYAFEDKSDRELTLRPELTAPVIRFYNQELRARPKPLRLFYYGNCFRYERPQSGRYREFWQFGAELVGAPGPEADAEIVAIANDCVEAAGAETELRIGHIGLLAALVRSLDVDDETRGEVFRRVDKGDEELEATLLDAGAAEPVARTVAALATGGDVPVDLDPDADALREAFREALGDVSGFDETSPHVDDGLADALGKEATARVQEAARELEDTLVHLADHGLDEARVDLGVARGLDYYAGVVFEIEAPELGAESQVAGGGRYELAETLGGQPTATTGFGLGFDRLLLASDVEADEPAADVHVVPIGDEARRPGARLAAELRDAGLRATVDLRDRSISKNLDAADSRGIPHVILLGSDELEDDVATVKDMATGEQTTVDRADVADHLREGST